MSLFEQISQIARPENHPALVKKRYSFTRYNDKSITSVIAYSLDEAQGKLDSKVSFRLVQIDKLKL